jgi:hypothetical protein
VDGCTPSRRAAVPETVLVVPFPAFSPCALAGIGDLPDHHPRPLGDRRDETACPNEHIEAFHDRHARPEGEMQRRVAWGFGARRLG